MQAQLRIGTRGSPLALVQAHQVQDRLAKASGRPKSDFPIQIISTSGDRIQDRPLADVGGKGLFTKEIEEALIAGTIDLAVHSMKDVATRLPDGLFIAATLEREDVRDAFISPCVGNLAALPPGAIVGTSSLRRQAQVLRLRPDLKVIGFRGNVETRLRKLDEKLADATLLAVAGLNRLGMSSRITSIIETETMLPAVAQGAVGIEIRSADAATHAVVAKLDHPATATPVAAERAFLAVLDGSCRTPIAGHARIVDGELRFAGEVLSPDGRQHFAASRHGPISDAIRLAVDAGEDILAQAGPDFLTRTS